MLYNATLSALIQTIDVTVRKLINADIRVVPAGVHTIIDSTNCPVLSLSMRVYIQFITEYG